MPLIFTISTYVCVSVAKGTEGKKYQVIASDVLFKICFPQQQSDIEAQEFYLKTRNMQKNTLSRLFDQYLWTWGQCQSTDSVNILCCILLQLHVRGRNVSVQFRPTSQQYPLQKCYLWI